MRMGSDCMEYRSVRKEIRDYMYQMIMYLPDDGVLASRFRETRIAFDLFTSLYETMREKETEIENMATDAEATKRANCC